MPTINITKTVSNLASVTGLSFTATAVQGVNTFPLTATYSAPNLTLVSSGSVGVSGNFTFNVTANYTAFGGSCSDNLTYVERITNFSFYTGSITAYNPGNNVSLIAWDVRFDSVYYTVSPPQYLTGSGWVNIPANGFSYNRPPEAVGIATNTLTGLAGFPNFQSRSLTSFGEYLIQRYDAGSGNNPTFSVVSNGNIFTCTAAMLWTGVEGVPSSTPGTITLDILDTSLNVVQTSTANVAFSVLQTSIIFQPLLRQYLIRINVTISGYPVLTSQINTFLNIIEV